MNKPNSFPEISVAKKAQQARLRSAHDKLRAESSYKEIRDWFLTSEYFKNAKTQIADWLEQETSDPNGLAKELAKEILDSGILSQIFHQGITQLEPWLTSEDAAVHISGILIDYAEQRLNDPILLQMICEKLEQKGGKLGSIAALMGLIDMRVLTHDIADEIKAWIAELAGPRMPELQNIVKLILQETGKINLNKNPARSILNTILTKAITNGARRTAVWIRTIEADSIPPWVDRLLYQLYLKLCEAGFALVETILMGRQSSGEMGSLVELFTRLVKE